MSTGVLAAYLVLTIIHHRKNLISNRFEIRFLIILILVNVSACIARNYVLGLSAGHFETVRLTQNTVSIGALGSFWSDLLYTFDTMCGFFVNPRHCY